ncbi:hypothetical protein FOXG_21525 [Fusarium oxysporum f. sp. lycopersici 4287]|uniref:Uncharacterized protein n=1 Tax=Fusarium oxysporum f. sp. lycopersici (strain 4287 / CBS 123668 / FGSC 9935 / NRRL 34936) TaxID=426428 RepID=A0A0J9VZG3_FUSO4|nr:hypothetical protein FOXG_21525 [Fusarium oxysporum f. sp. lycopersici 4287]KNB15910.1 hypothetical protein FOXG_21525 [Fusarium oxysporum f. sp. lycopersici 4287]
MATWTCAKSKIHPWTDVPVTADPPHTFSWMVNFRAPVNHTKLSREERETGAGGTMQRRSKVFREV